MNKTVKSIISEVGKLKLDKIDGCEVGVWKGVTSEQLLKNLKTLYLTMVDSWQYFGSQMNITSQQEALDAMKEAEDRVSFASERKAIIRLSSIRAAKLFENSRFDFVYIDADHLYESVWEDVNTWWPKVKNGGLLMGHDYGGRMDRKGKWGISKAVNEFVKEHKLELEVFPGLVWRIQK